MPEELRGFRGRIVPEKDPLVAEPKKEVFIPEHKRGRLVDGVIVPDEERQAALMAKQEQQGGVLAPKDEAELRDLTFKLEGDSFERASRARRQKK